jgi:lipid-A-disaccharide synthase
MRVLSIGQSGRRRLDQQELTIDERKPMPDSPKRILIVAGEASADRYGAKLVQQLRSLHRDDCVYFYGTGGDEMEAAGVHLYCHVRELAHIGAREALTSLRTYYRTYRRLVHKCVEAPPQAAVLLDFPDFNLRLAKKLKRLGIPVIYYISPQVWAWRSGRVRTIREYVDRMLVILPFEEEYYRERGIEVEFVGHPLLEDFRPDYNRDSFLKSLHLDPDRRTVAILAGSRRKEIDYILPVLLRAGQLLAQEIPVQFVISAAPTVDADHIKSVLETTLRDDPCRDLYRISSRNSRDILANSDFAFVKSGTSSLEAALIGVPFLIAYKISPLSWYVGSILIRSSMKGLVNLIAKERIVPELFQNEAEPQRLAQLALKYLGKTGEADAMRSQLARIREQLSTRCASATVAATVSRYL